MTEKVNADRTKSELGESSDTIAPTKQNSAGALVVESDTKGDKDQELFNAELNRSLSETEAQIATLVKTKPDKIKSWQQARTLVEDFKPVPWFIWRLSNFVFGKSGQINVVPQGMVMGLRRLMFAAASDSILGSGQPVNNMKIALSFLRSDVIAAVSVIHAICRKVATKENDRIWRPILDDAILRAQIGYFAGERRRTFGCGRGMLAGFASRAGLALLLSSGNIEQARLALEQIAGGDELSDVGLKLYGCDPLQVSSMMLSASGCGKDAAFGVANFAAKEADPNLATEEQRAWLGALTVCESVRMGYSEKIEKFHWELLQYHGEEERQQLADMAKLLVRTGTNWEWLS